MTAASLGGPVSEALVKSLARCTALATTRGPEPSRSQLRPVAGAVPLPRAPSKVVGIGGGTGAYQVHQEVHRRRVAYNRRRLQLDLASDLHRRGCSSVSRLTLLLNEPQDAAGTAPTRFAYCYLTTVLTLIQVLQP